MFFGYCYSDNNNNKNENLTKGGQGNFQFHFIYLFMRTFTFEMIYVELNFMDMRTRWFNSRVNDDLHFLLKHFTQTPMLKFDYGT